MTPAGFEDALFRVGEGAEVRGRKLVEGAFEVVKARLDRGGRLAQGGGALFVGLRLGAPGVA
jgi:hypothetical protein